MSEIELKFLLDAGGPAAIWSRVKASRLTGGSRSTHTLRSTYLDTPDHALRQAGIAFRIRRDGRRWLQTVKTGRTLQGGLSLASEIETAAPGGRPCLDALPDASVREEVERLIGEAPLAAICETVIKRTRSEITGPDGTRAELAVDVGEIRAGERSAPLSELELELIEGSPAGLYGIAHMLLPEGGLRFSQMSKSDRGYLLAAENRIDAPLAPRNARAVTLEAGLTGEQAARVILRECLDQIAGNVTVLRELDAMEGPHQLRVGLRRLRSAFALLRPVLASPEMDRLGAEARWLGQEVGSLRDLDVVAREMVMPEAARHPGEPALSALADALLRQGQDRRDALRLTLAGPRTQAFLIDLARFIETRGWLLPQDFEQTARLAEPVGALAGQALDKRWKACRKRARGLGTLSEDERHELRKELKKLRYAVEFFSSLFPAKRLDPFLADLKTLQTDFGNLNDAATVRGMFAGEGCLGADDARLQRGIGWIIGASLARAEHGWSHARTHWRALKQETPFWR